jgi:DNA-directed RNA polymerase subunit RPC12/RpoP
MVAGVMEIDVRLGGGPSMSDATKRTAARFLTGSVSCLFLCASISVAAQPEVVDPKAAPRKVYAEEYHPALKDNAKPIPDLLIYGPDAPACVKFEPAGLHITLPLGYPKQRPGTGVVTDFGVKGDFEITVAFEILPGKDLGPPAGWANFRIAVVPNEPAEKEIWHKADQNRALLVREITRKDGVGQFFGNATKWNPDVPRDEWGNEQFANVELHKGKRSAATALTGRLRLVRRGADLLFFTSEERDNEFKLLHQYEFGVKDLKNVRVLASTGGTGAALDVLVTDLHIRADGFIKGAAAPPPQPAAAPRSLTVPIAVGSAVLMVLILLLSVGAWLFLRSSRVPFPAQSAGALVFACSQCGKKIKTKSERAGKTLKCPHCASAVTAPREEPEEAEEA